MKRLTRYFYDKDAGIDCEKCGRRKTGKCNTSADCAKSASDRLAAIEDILGDDYDLDSLLELVEADMDGRCIIIPKKYELYSIVCQDKDGIYTKNNWTDFEKIEPRKEESKWT